MSEQNRDSMANELGTSAKTAANAAKTAISAAKDVAKVAGKLATGNVAGAAIDALRSKTIRNIIIVVLCITLTLPVLVLYAIPSMAFSAVQSYVEQMDEEIMEQISGSGNSLQEFLLGLALWTTELNGKFGGAAGRLSASTLSAVTSSLYNKGEAGERVEEYDSYVYDTVTDESAAVRTIQTQVTKVCSLFQVRRDQYQEMLESMADYFENNPPAAARGYDVFDVRAELNAPVVSEREAAQYIAAYSVQRGNGLENVTLRSLLSWVGYYNGIWKNDMYRVEGVSFYTFKWHGDYLPQYQYEQMTSIPDSERFVVELDGSITELPPPYQTKSFLEQVYYVDKERGITTSYEPYEFLAPVIDESSNEPLLDANGDIVYETKTGLRMTIQMEITLISQDEIADRVMGFWSGDLSEVNERTGTNRGIVDASDPNLLALEWVYDDEVYTRKAGYQTQYFSQLQQTVSQYIGLQSFVSADIDYSVIGATRATTDAAERVVQIAEGELGTIGGYPYWTLGSPGQAWCNWFIKWCGIQAGLGDPGEVFYPMSGGCITTWRRYGGTADGTTVTYTGGSTAEGTAIVVDDTVLLAADRMDSITTHYIPQRGDLVLYGDRERGWIGHIGIVESYDIYTNDLITIEGNTGPGASNYDRGVYIMHRTTTQKFGTNYKRFNIVGFIHLNYPADEETP